MKFTVVAILCHGLTVASSNSTCREEVVTRAEGSIASCMLAQAEVAGWKEASIYRDAEWKVDRIKCVAGDYIPRGAI